MKRTTSITDQYTEIAHARGFSLIELVVTMLIVAILAAVAVPAYSNYVRKSRRTEAKSTLLDMASLEERYFSTNNAYSQTPSDLGYGAAAVVPFPVGNSYYNITVLQATQATAPANSTSAGTPASFTITATAINDQAKDLGCTSFTLDQTGLQTATGTDSANCWK